MPEPADTEQPEPSRPMNRRDRAEPVDIGIRFHLGLVGAVGGGAVTYALGWAVFAILEWMYPPARGHVIDLSGLLLGLLWYAVSVFIWPVGAALGAIIGAVYVAPWIAQSSKY